MIDYYCVHHSPAVDRKAFVQKIAENQKIDIEWIESWPPESFKNHPIIPNKHAANGEFLNEAELSCYYKHLDIYKKIQEKDTPYAMIFEDDIDHIDFSLQEILPIFCKDMSNSAIFFVGTAFGWGLENEGYAGIKYAFNPPVRQRCSHAYLINKKFLINNNFLSYMQDIRSPLDIQLGDALVDFELNSAWTFPHIYQRTNTGELLSLIR
jgi:GR25 family glycosyltransferase involved in LPS biosynthesis